MSEEQTNTPVSPYLAYYGMTREAFAEPIEDDLFYAEPSRKQRLEILLHLCQYGHELMLVIGPEGSGKTTLLQQFQAQALDSWSIAHIKAEGGIDERQLLQQLFHQTKLDYHGATKHDLYETIRHHYEGLQHSARLGIIIVDDAEQLNITGLKNILALAAIKNAEKKPILRVILFAKESLKALLEDSQIGHLANIPQREIDLSAFDKEQTSHYILHRLSMANFSSPQPFTDAVLGKIYKQSAGWPRRINELAHDVLLKSLPAKLKQDDSPAAPSSFRPLRLLALLITISVISGLLVFQDEVNPLFQPSQEQATTVPLTLPPEQELTAAQTLLPTTPAEQPEENQETVSTLDNKEPETLPPEPKALTTMPTIEPDGADTPAINQITDTPKTSAKSTGPEATSPAAQVATAEVDIPTSPVAPLITAEDSSRMDQAEAGESAQTPALAKQTPDSTTTNPTPEEALFAGMPDRQNHWLQQQPATHFTLQLVAGNNLETIQRFINEHQLSDNLAFYHTTRQGKPWYGLVFSIFETKQAAIDARSQLPSEIRRLEPWVRDLSGLQKSLPTLQNP